MAIICEHGIRELRDAILIQAIKDYRTALKSWDPHVYGDEVEQFFLSDWGQWLSGNRGEQLIKMCKRSVFGKEKSMEVIMVKVLCASDTAQDVADSIKACAEQMEAHVEDIRREKV